MKLITGEKTLLESDDNVVILTTHRIRYNAKKSGNSDFASIMLDEVASCSITSKSKPIFMILGILSALYCLYQMSRGYNINSILPFIVVAVIFIVIYYVSVNKYLEVASAGSPILINMSRMNMTKIIDFVDELELAKHNRSSAIK